MLVAVLSQVANGLVLGGLYVLIAIGLSIIFGLLGIVNFAHGDVLRAGRLFRADPVQYFGWPAVILAPILVGLVGMVVERLLIRQLYDKEPLISLIVTFALALMIEALMRLIWGGIGQPFSPPPFLSGIYPLGTGADHQVPAGGVPGTVVLLVALWAFLQFTPFGRILRAGSRDPEMVGPARHPPAARADRGVRPGLLRWPASPACWPRRCGRSIPSMSENAIMPAFVVVTIGGLGSFAGAVIAGLLVGVVTALTIQFEPAAASAVMYVFMAVVLLLRPRGLLGERWERFE